MRLKLLSAGILLAGSLAGCAKVTPEQGIKAFHKELHLYFNNLNNEAQARKDEFRKNDVKLGLVMPTGSIYSTFVFDENAFIVRDFKCKTCETKLIITSPGTEYLCPSCGHCPYVAHSAGFNRKESPCKVCIGTDGKPKEPNADLIKREMFEQAGAKVEAMFEIDPAKNNPNGTMAATVRYVRRQWAYDQRGVVDISQRVIERASVVTEYIPGEAQNFSRPGYHRLDASFVGQLRFEFRSGELTLDKRWAEEAVRPWKDLKGNQ
jgi:predicted RNA-binding Zn-ribbon protein involved in translation (DUF1610 family)